MKKLFNRLINVLTITLLWGMATANAAQVVLLDFDTGTDGTIDYTVSMRDQIQALMEGHYADFDITVTQVTPGSGDYSTVFFNSGGAGGLASQVDFRNTDMNDTAVVNIDGFGFVTTADIVSATAIIGSHEFGHLLGLRHGDSFGPIGMGLSNTGVPTAASYTPAYPGPATGDETRNHLMASPVSVGSTLGDTTTPSWLSERSAIKLSNNEQGTVQSEGAGPTPLTLETPIVPNTIVTGDNAGEVFVVKLFTVAGSIGDAGESDLYTFSGLAGDVFSFEVISDLIDYREANTVDSQISIFDSTATLVAYYATTAVNDNEFETPDSIIIDLVLPADDTYTIQVISSPGAPNDTGAYEVLGYSLELENEPPVAEDNDYETLEDTVLNVAAPGVLNNDSDADGDPLTAVEDSSTSDGSLTLNANGSFDYDPDADFCGSDSFTYHANDGTDDSNIATVTITVTCVNDAPVAVNNNYTHDEDTQLTGNVITDDTGEGLDSDVDGDGLSMNSNTGAAHGTVVFNADNSGSFTYDPNQDYCGPDSFTYVITDDPPTTPPPLTSNTATVSITVTCVNDPPVVTSVSPAAQTADYSDFIGTVTITATDVDDTNLTLAESGAPSALPNPALNTTGSCTTVPNESIVDGSSCTWTMDGQVLVPGDNVHNIDFTASDDEPSSSTDNFPTTRHVLTVQAEDATVELDGDNEVAVEVATEGGDSGEFNLWFSAMETNDPDNAHDGTPEFGDLNTMVPVMTLIPVGPGGPVSAESCVFIPDLPVYPGEGYGQVALFECTFDEVPVNTYEILAQVTGSSDTTIYYAGSDEGVFVVYDPSLGFTTGGGWFYWPDTDETDYPGDRTNFGFNMKYNKKMTNVQGNLLLMRHTISGETYKVKSNALDGLAIGDGTDGAGDYGWAAFSGKSTYREPGFENEGNHPFLVYVEDHDEQGCNQDPSDEFWIEVKNKDGNIVLEVNGPDSDPAGADAATDGDDVPVECGNIIVPQKAGGKGKGKP